MLPWVARIACLICPAGRQASPIRVPPTTLPISTQRSRASAPTTGSRSAICAPATSTSPRSKSTAARCLGQVHRALFRQSAGRIRGTIRIYGKLFTVVNARLVGVDLMLKTGRLDAARNGLNAIRRDLYDLRKASGVVVLADCVRDANATMDALMIYNDRALDWDKPGYGSAASPARHRAYGTVLESLRQHRRAKRCASMPEFRRLVDGAKASLDADSEGNCHPRRRSPPPRSDRAALVRQFARCSASAERSIASRLRSWPMFCGIARSIVGSLHRSFG